MAAPVNARAPFTAAQWQELERQTMIYKYMTASEPVPPDLPIPLTRNPSNGNVFFFFSPCVQCYQCSVKLLAISCCVDSDKGVFGTGVFGQ